MQTTRVVRLLQYQFEEPEGRATYTIVPEAKAILEDLTDPFVVVGLFGPMRAGKSWLASRLLQRLDDLFERIPDPRFPTSSEVEACTKGIWLGVQNASLRRTIVDDTMPGPPRRRTITAKLLLLDAEGTEDCKSDSQHARLLCVFIVLASSLVIYNYPKLIQQEALTKLAITLRQAHNLAAANLPNATTNNQNPWRAEFPSFLWLVRDFTLRLTTSPSQYLETNLDAAYEQEDAHMIQRCFANRSCRCLPPPCDARYQKSMDSNGKHLNRTFQLAVRELHQYLQHQAPLKRFRGNLLTGKTFVRLLEMYVDALNQCELPNFENAFRLWHRNRLQDQRSQWIAKYRSYENEFLALPIFETVRQQFRHAVKTNDYRQEPSRAVSQLWASSYVRRWFRSKRQLLEDAFAELLASRDMDVNKDGPRNDAQQKINFIRELEQEDGERQKRVERHVRQWLEVECQRYASPLLRRIEACRKEWIRAIESITITATKGTEQENDLRFAVADGELDGELGNGEPDEGATNMPRNRPADDPLVARWQQVIAFQSHVHHVAQQIANIRQCLLGASELPLECQDLLQHELATIENQDLSRLAEFQTKKNAACEQWRLAWQQAKHEQTVLEERRQTQKQELVQCQEHATVLTEQLQTLRETLASAESKLSSYESRVTDLEATALSHHALQKRHLDLQEEYEQLKSSTNEERTRSEEMKEQYAAHMDELRETTILKLARLTKLRTEEETRYRTLESECRRSAKRFREEEQKWERLLRQKHTSETQLQQHVDRLVEEQKNGIRQIQQWKIKCSDAEQKIEAFMREQDEEKNKYVRLSNVVTKLKQEFSANRVHCDKLQHKLHETEERERRQLIELTRCESKIAALEERQERYDQLLQQKTELEKEVAILRIQRETQKEKLDRLQCNLGKQTERAREFEKLYQEARMDKNQRELSAIFRQYESHHVD